MKKPRSRALTPKQQRFIAEYLATSNAKQAAITAGYSARSGAKTVCAMLKKSRPVQRAIIEARAARERRTEISVERVLKEYARIAFADIRNFIQVTEKEGEKEGEKGVVKLKPLAELSEDDAAAVAELQGPGPRGGAPRLRLHDKRAALDVIARHLGLLPKGQASREDWERDGVYGPKLPAREILRRRLDAIARANNQGE